MHGGVKEFLNMMENPAKLEDPEVKKDEAIALDSDLKSASDSKNVQARIVRGTKKMRIDSTESSQVSARVASGWHTLAVL